MENGDEALTIFIKSQRNGDQAYDMSMLQNWLIELVAQHVQPYSSFQNQTLLLSTAKFGYNICPILQALISYNRISRLSHLKFLFLCVCVFNVKRIIYETNVRKLLIS